MFRPKVVKAARWQSRSFKSALWKLTVDEPLYDHLVHNLLASYKLLIEQLLKKGDTSTALDFLRGALRLEIRGGMAEDSAFLRKFAGAFSETRDRLLPQ